MDDYWGKLWKIIGTALMVAAIVAIIGGGYILANMAYNAYERGEDKRAAQNQTNIERERLQQEAFRQYIER